MAEQDHEQLAAELERETDRLQRESERVAANIEEVRADWLHQQPDGGVPGAGAAEGESGVASAPDDRPDADPPDPAAASANQ
jgi:hypothetical protein